VIWSFPVTLAMLAIIASSKDCVKDVSFISPCPISATGRIDHADKRADEALDSQPNGKSGAEPRAALRPVK